MRIEQKAEGWTVATASGRIMLIDRRRAPVYLATKQGVLDQCHYAGFYEGTDGTLLELVVAKPEDSQLGSPLGGVAADPLETHPGNDKTSSEDPQP
jgi:hypothetical protein